MATYILIHGAWRSKVVWNKITLILEAEGHIVLTPNLPGHEQNIKLPVPPTLESYVNAIIELVNQQNDKVILVGHSMAGAVISLVAEQIPNKIEKLVYLCAFLLKDGEAMNDIILKQEHPVLELEFNENYSYATLKKESIIAGLYNNTDYEEAVKEISSFVPQAMELFATPLKLTEDNYGSIPRIYIACIRDKAIRHDTQQAMLAKQECKNIFSLDTDHSSFLSSPQELGEILLRCS